MKAAGFGGYAAVRDARIRFPGEATIRFPGETAAVGLRAV
jgi:hypothetical protein